MRRPLVMITNDDSIDAPGIHALAEYVRPLADVYIIAPKNPQSGQSSSMTIGSPLVISEKPSPYEDVRMFVVNGTPVDCVKLGLDAIVPRKPDLLLSGINHGSNSGTAITYSGTMGAVLEGCMVGIPSVGFSLLHHSMKADFSLSADIVKNIIANILKEGLPSGECLNINIPAKVVPKGIRTCRAAHGHWSEEYKRYLDPLGNPFYWLTGRFVNEEPDATDTDEYWLTQQYVTIVPVTPDQSLMSSIESTSQRFDCDC